jgi:hypothetical protein
MDAVIEQLKVISERPVDRLSLAARVEIANALLGGKWTDEDGVEHESPSFITDPRDYLAIISGGEPLDK